MVSNKVTYFQPKIMRDPWLCSLKGKKTYMEVILQHHQLQFGFSLNKGEGKRGTIRIQTIIDNINGPDCSACSEVQKGEGTTQTQGVEGLWAKRVSERQTSWPFSTLHWQMVIRGNYKMLLATNNLIMLWEWEPNVIMALWYADPVPSGTKPRHQTQQSNL